MKDIVFSTGTFLKAENVQINGVNQWRWVVTSFEDDVFQNGKEINVLEYANSFEELFCKSDRKE